LAVFRHFFSVAAFFGSLLGELQQGKVEDLQAAGKMGGAFSSRYAVPMMLV